MDLRARPRDTCHLDDVPQLRVPVSTSRDRAIEAGAKATDAWFDHDGDLAVPTGHHARTEAALVLDAAREAGHILWADEQVQRFLDEQLLITERDVVHAVNERLVAFVEKVAQEPVPGPEVAYTMCEEARELIRDDAQEEK